MAHEVYVGIESGLSRNIDKIYVGDNSGISRKVRRGYVGDSEGKARLFYASIYVWNRYSVNYRYVYGYTVESHSEYRLGTETVICYIITLNNYNRYTGDWNNQRRTDISPSIVGKWILTERNGSSAYYITRVPYESGGYNARYTKTARMRQLDTQEASQGTYIDQVESENPSAYPNNGQSGNYWYVLQTT